MQRIRIGLTGLACVFLLVLIGAAGLAPTKSQIAAAKLGVPEEPLAQLGVAPGSTAAGAAEQTQGKTIPLSPARRGNAQP
jgi:hypothetical protein